MTSHQEIPSPMTPQTRLLPPIDWSMILPETLSFHERESAHLPIYILARPDSDRPVSVTYGAFARACRRVPRILGLTSEELVQRPVIAILAHTDTLIYQTVVLGLMLAGAVPFPISTRNTAGAVLHLLESSSSQRLIMNSEAFEQRSADILQELTSRDPTWPSRISQPPVLGQLYPTFDCSIPADCDTSYGDELWEKRPDINSACVYLHSSGSTGLPKVVPMSHYEVIKYMRFAPAMIYRSQTVRTQLACMELPPFHGMAFIYQLCVPLFHGASTVIVFPTVKLPRDIPIALDADNVIHLIHRTHARACLTIPAFLHLWVHNTNYVEILKELEFVQYGGGLLSPTVGEILVSAGVKLRCSYGGSEFGACAMAGVRPEDEGDWEYLELAEGAYPQFVHQGDGTYELQLISPDEYPLSVTNIPNVNGYATSDLFIPHPTKNHLWKLVGRIDDVIVHSSGEKSVPGPIEFIIQGCPHVSGAVMFGAGRIQPGMLIEPRDEFCVDSKDPDAVAILQDLVWPFIESANAVAPSFSQITRDMIIFTSRDKPLPRTAKLTIPSKASWNLYAEEIEKAYHNSRLNRWNDSSSAQPLVWDEHHIVQWLLSHVQDLSSGRNINAYDNLFQQGFDSMGATMLRRIISRAISTLQGTNGKRGAALDVVYQYPSIRSLARYLTSFINKNENEESPSSARVNSIESMIARYSFKEKPTPALRRTSGDRQPTVVLITGSTGSLGSQVLAKLLCAANVAKIYTLNRPGALPIMDRHIQRFRHVGLEENLLRLPKLVHLEGHYENVYLGISALEYKEIRDSVTLIIHTAWRMDFNLALDSFESVVQATHNLAAFGLEIHALRRIRLIFTSSVGVAQGWNASLGPYPEQVILDGRYATGSGYGEAKYVCERIIATSELETTSIRISQMVGREKNGAWSSYDWVPIMFQSSAALGGLPTASGTISWISPDTVAGVIIDLANYTESYPQALNIVNPQPITWNDMVRNIQQAMQLECGIHLPLIPYEDWFSALEHSASSVQDTKDIIRIPAIKLVNFFDHLARKNSEDSQPGETEAFNFPTFSTDKCTTISGTLAAQPPLSKHDIYQWVQYWAKNGILPRV